MSINEFLNKYIFSFFHQNQPESEISLGNVSFSPVKLNGPYSYSSSTGRYTINEFHKKSDLGKLIHIAKSKGSQQSAIVLAQFMMKFLTEFPIEIKPDLVVTIPDSIINRPFSPIKIISDQIADHFGWSVNHHIFTRKRLLSPQKRRSWEERIADEEDRYSIVAPEVVKNKDILLIDDIYATGKSLDEAANHLHRTGAKSVSAVVIVKLSRPQPD